MNLRISRDQHNSYVKKTHQYQARGTPTQQLSKASNYQEKRSLQQNKYTPNLILKK